MSLFLDYYSPPPCCIIFHPLFSYNILPLSYILFPPPPCLLFQDLLLFAADFVEIDKWKTEDHGASEGGSIIPSLTTWHVGNTVRFNYRSSIIIVNRRAPWDNRLYKATEVRPRCPQKHIYDSGKGKLRSHTNRSTPIDAKK